LAATLLAAPCRAADLPPYDGWNAQWDTTVRVSLGLRTEAADPAILANINADDGDRAFTPGIMSARTDVSTDFTATRGGFGIDLSAQGWYDPVYFHANANESPQTFNPVSVPYGVFPAGTRQVDGGEVELFNALAKDNTSIAGVPVSFSVGRQTLIWGESLFFASNGIAAGQSPIDEIKSLGAPLAEARELYLPVAQAVLRVQLAPGFSLEAYDQFEWRRDRLPGVSSYFSTTDILDEGGERLLFPGYIPPYYRASDQTPQGFGQFGAALRYSADTIDLGLYALRWDAKSPSVTIDPETLSYRLVFPKNIVTEGVSASTYVGDSTLAGEISFRQHMPLAGAAANTIGDSVTSSPGGGVYSILRLPGFFTPPPSLPPPTLVRYGDTIQAQASFTAQLPPSRWWNGATWQTEFAGNGLLDATPGSGRTRYALAGRTVFTPSYYQVLPGLDISFPIGMGYDPAGRSSIDPSQQSGAGDITAGISAKFRTVWLFAASFTHFIGGAGAQPLADRDFAVFSVSRSF
jgi:hypothetical protein